MRSPGLSITCCFTCVRSVCLCVCFGGEVRVRRECVVVVTTDRLLSDEAPAPRRRSRTTPRRVQHERDHHPEPHHPE
uniref:Putative secreted peptide n=1 Tax=Anopheles braziliensis TaxID=58242 RepID=A0A2M3ZP01_9DIPT